MVMRFCLLIFICIARSAFALDAEAVFNEPGFHGQPSYTIENKLVSLIDQAAPDSEIHMSMYQMTRTPVIKALIRASHRGVDVHMVFDGSNYFDNLKPGNGVDLLVNGSEETGRLICKTKPCVRFCSGPLHVKIKGQTFGGSCNGLVINHNKFLLFSKLMDGSENVVAQSSSNLEDEQMHDYQDLVIIRGDRGLYEGYLDYWQQQNRDKTHYLDTHKDAVGDGSVVAKFFPRVIARDPVMQLLRRVSCEPAGSMIRVAEADINRLNVAARLRDLAKAGCDVKVITRIDPEMFSPTVGVVKRLGSNILILPFQGKTALDRAVNTIHTKLILIDAAIDGSTERRQMVVTGSHNLDFFSLHTNDETLLEIEDTPLYSTYLAFWNRINSEARASGMRLLTGKDRHPKPAPSSENELTSGNVLP